MTFWDVQAVCARINLCGGRISVRESQCATVFMVEMQVKDRENHDRLIWIASRHEVHPTRLVDEKYVLYVVQEIWTSMWMHESLEAFVLITPEHQLTLPFDPHCWDKLEIKPSHMGFLTDSQCQPVAVHNPLKDP